MVDFSIKRVPDDLAKRLRRRAERHHRSLQGELLAILHDAATAESGAPASMVRESAAPTYRTTTGRRRVAPASESALIIRQAREGRTFTIADLHAFASGQGLRTPDEATEWIRKERKRR
jgi:plasmid stability protein